VDSPVFRACLPQAHGQLPDRLPSFQLPLRPLSRQSGRHVLHSRALCSSRYENPADPTISFDDDEIFSNPTAARTLPPKCLSRRSRSSSTTAAASAVRPSTSARTTTAPNPRAAPGAPRRRFWQPSFLASETWLPAREDAALAGVTRDGKKKRRWFPRGNVRENGRPFFFFFFCSSAHFVQATATPHHPSHTWRFPIGPRLATNPPGATATVMHAEASDGRQDLTKRGEQKVLRRWLRSPPTDHDASCHHPSPATHSLPRPPTPSSGRSSSPPPQPHPEPSHAQG
jgi:hypothetical protein